MSAALVAVAILLRFMGFAQSGRLLWWLVDQAPTRRLEQAAQMSFAISRGQVIDGVARRLPRPPRCLARALLLGVLLRRQMIDGELVLGVAQGPVFDAHAWVEISGVPVNDAPDHVARYRRLWQLRTLAA